MVVPPSNVNALLSNAVTPGNVPSGFNLTLPTISPLIVKASPGGSIPLVKIYFTLASGTVLVAVTLR